MPRSRGGSLAGVASLCFCGEVVSIRKFSELARELDSVLNTSVAAAIIDYVAADYPDLDNSKYGYEVMSDDATLRVYAKALSEGMKAFPVLESLASSPIVLIAEAIRAYQVDKDVCLEAVIVSLDNSIEERTADDAKAEAEEARQDEEATRGVS